MIAPGTWFNLKEHAFVPAKYVGLKCQAFSWVKPNGMAVVNVYKEGRLFGTITVPHSALELAPQSNRR